MSYLTLDERGASQSIRCFSEPTDFFHILAKFVCHFVGQSQAGSSELYH